MTNWLPDRRTMIAIMIVGSLVLCIFFLILRPTTADSDILKMLIGALIASSSQIIQFDFGSSVGSESKQKTIDRIMDGTPVPTAIPPHVDVALIEQTQDTPKAP